MAKSPNQKLKLLYLMKILQEKTDENHPLTVPQLIEELERYNILPERKSVYDDIEALRIFGLDIENAKGRSGGYYVSSRTFELPELKLLVDSVQASKFITHKKSLELIKKLESFASRYEAQQLQRQVYVTNRIKAMNESIYYNIDAIHSAIAENRQITFKYFEYSIKKERVYKHNGACYHISPLALTWDDENYYMLGYDGAAGMIKHYRVDKMESIEITQTAREGIKEFEAIDMAVYSKKIFSMFGGKEESLKLRFSNELIGVVIDRFGKDVPVEPDGEGHFIVHENVFISPQFFGWLCSFGGKAKILAPEQVKEAFARHVQGVLEEQSR
ncbi:helix-turn-helix transcriptional regulator [Acetanaerobacterium elongatum]|uniref:Predicted DNA-binding transcriptional regulator YafY, contains an HTH and WYL domains n=1 Tax=Acetanaerobacterium elongatum TaxID=258515 RepID=A0A1G9UPI7_9FIRM|nr:WYL domain-containing protein [Acetanaerobacterium elongatum]SDM61776.1 Predicted DNA-binding transcriptional regulator YafY, contains an HTH and WYL domains [Acetanaerobacterium elongatum]